MLASYTSSVQLSALLGTEVEVQAEGLPVTTGIVYSIDPATRSVALLQAREQRSELFLNRLFVEIFGTLLPSGPHRLRERRVCPREQGQHYFWGFCSEHI